jgi:N-acetylglucosamine-6-phosphate deacetylase
LATVLTARQLFTPVERIEDAVLVIEDGQISAVGSRDAISIHSNARLLDYGDSILAPGLIDIHVHGGAGHDVMEFSEDSLGAIEKLMARHGVTSYCPTTVTAPVDATLKSLNHLAQAVQAAEARQSASSGRARPLGIHLEGPFLSHARRGVHPPNLLVSASQELFDQFWDAAAGQVSVLTIAPEIDGAIELIGNATRRGVCVSLGHSDADLRETTAGIQAGARHATHTFNAMRPLNHRDPGLLGVVLTNPSVTADIIADGIHVDPVVVDLFLRAKGIDAAILITDGISATGMPDGTYKLGDLNVEVRDGRCEVDGRLAGSVLTLDRAVRNVRRFANIGFQDSVRLGTLNPARVLGVQKHKGMLAVGADADVVVFSPDGDVRQTIIGGVLN